MRWVLLGNFWVDGREENSLARTRPVLWKYLMDHFETVTDSGVQAGYTLMKWKD